MNTETTGTEKDAPELTAEDWDYLNMAFAPMLGYVPPKDAILPFSMVLSLLSLARRTQAAEKELADFAPLLDLLDRQGVPTDTPDYPYYPKRAPRFERVEWLLKNRRQLKSSCLTLSGELKSGRGKGRGSRSRTCSNAELGSRRAPGAGRNLAPRRAYCKTCQ